MTANHDVFLTQMEHQLSFDQEIDFNRFIESLENVNFTDPGGNMPFDSISCVSIAHVEGGELQPLLKATGIQEPFPSFVPFPSFGPFEHNKEILDPTVSESALAISRPSAPPPPRLPVPLFVRSNGIKRHDEHGKRRCVGHFKTRIRSPDWSGEEKRAYLELKVEALGAVVGKPDWDFISQCLQERHKCVRNPKCCEDLWGTLQKHYFTIQKHENLSKYAPRTSNWVSYWEMDEGERSRKKLPQSFSSESYTIIEKILTAQANRSRKKNKEDPAEESVADKDDDRYSYLY